MKIETTPDKIVHFVFQDVVMDRFWHLKNATYCELPYHKALLAFYEQREQVFIDLCRPDWMETMYWKSPPILELPERAESLGEEQADFNSSLPVPEYHYTGTVTVWTETNEKIKLPGVPI